MIRKRLSAERGRTDIGWLDSRHSFSFGGYRDARHAGFHDLLVINEDRVAPGAGFGRHGHADMEIVSFVISGALGHRDSTGTDGVIRPGEIQRMTAGTGIEHSEMNASATDPVHFLQIWIAPERRGLAPGYEQVVIPPPVAGHPVQAIARPGGGPGTVALHADASIHRAMLAAGEEASFEIVAGRAAWAQVVSGSPLVDGEALLAGDGLAIEDRARLLLDGGTHGAELLLFDLA